MFLLWYSQEIVYKSQLEVKQILIKVQLAKEEANMKKDDSIQFQINI